MQIENQKEVIQNCRFCLMCRHTCTVAKFTKNESDTPRAKALNLWTVLEKMREYNSDDAEIFFNCVDCQKCKEHCVSDYDVPALIEAARKDLVEADIVPKKIREIRDSILQKGNPFNTNNSTKFETAACDTLLFPGCEIAINTPELIDKASSVMKNLNPGVLHDACCGAPLKNLGYTEDAVSLGKNLISQIKKTKAKELIVFCPSCYFMLTHGYKELGIKIPKDISIKFYLEVLYEKFSDRKINVKKNEKYIIHDPCSTGRMLHMYDLPRSILNLLGVEILEPFLNKGESPCCGGSIVSRQVSEELSVNAADLIFKEAKEKKADGIITSCPSCRFHLKRQTKDTKILDFIDLINAEH